jgi:predicted dehydrogenase
MKIGIIGLGYWGPNLVRNFFSHPNVQSITVCDLRKDRLQFIKSRFPSVVLSNETDSFIKSDVDIIAIATPVRTHYDIAKKALASGKHIWVEKPFTSTTKQALELIELADRKNLKIFVDHTFIYTGAVRKIKELIDANELGTIKYFDSVRINLGLFQHDINVIWDLAPHDLSILGYLLSEKKVVAVSANGIANYYDHENIAQLSLYFNDDCFGNIHINWTSPVKIRRVIIGGSSKMLLYDDMENFEKIKIYDSGIEMTSSESIHEALVQYRIGDMYSPKVLGTEALALGVQEFLRAIDENREPLTGGKDGLKVVSILEASEKSIKMKGNLVEVKM